MNILSLIFRIIGIPGVVALGMYIFYEGLPIGPLRDIPFAGDYLAMMTDGRVDREYKAGQESVRAEARTRALELIQQRNEDDAEISTYDQSRLCAELGGRWVPNERRCD